MDILAEVAAAHRRGRLVPFIGSGLSRPVCRNWSGMIARLEAMAGITGAGGQDNAALVRRAALALDRLRLGQGRPTSEIIAGALLEGAPAPPTDSAAALAEHHWPLVLSTNYDDLYPAAAQQAALSEPRNMRKNTDESERRRPVVEVVGRSSVDCHRVLSSLSYPAVPLLWAMQGYLGGQALIRRPAGSTLFADWVHPGHNAAELAAQIVVGHAEYRRAALRSESFRRAFAEVFRSRSLLFLGSGLSDPYLLDLFGQVIELYGPGGHPHFAVSTRNELDAPFLRRHFGIWVHEIDDHDELPGLIRALGADAARTPAGLKVVVGGLPDDPPAGSCVMVSGGGSQRERLRVNPGMVDYLRRNGFAAPPEFTKDPRRDYVWHAQPSGDGPFPVITRARLDPQTDLGRRVRPLAPGATRSTDNKGRTWRDIRVVAPALRETLAVAAGAGKTVVLATLLASGDLRTISPSYALIEMIRAWTGSPLRDRIDLVVHVVDDDVIYDITAGRVDVDRLIATPAGGPIRFWLESRDPDGVVSRFLMLERSGRSVTGMLDDIGVAGEEWTVTVEPEPCLDWKSWRLGDIRRAAGPAMTLERFGVLDGSTMRVAPREPARAATVPTGRGEP